MKRISGNSLHWNRGLRMPNTSIAVPVMAEDSDDARKTTTAAISSGASKEGAWMGRDPGCFLTAES